MVANRARWRGARGNADRHLAPGPLAPREMAGNQPLVELLGKVVLLQRGAVQRDGDVRRGRCAPGAGPAHRPIERTARAAGRASAAPRAAARPRRRSGRGRAKTVAGAVSRARRRRHAVPRGRARAATRCGRKRARRPRCRARSRARRMRSGHRARRAGRRRAGPACDSSIVFSASRASSPSASGHSVAATRAASTWRPPSAVIRRSMIEQPFRRFAREPDRHAVALHGEAAQRMHAQRPGPADDADVGAGQRARRDRLAREGGVRVELERCAAQLGGDARQGAEEVREIDAARLDECRASARRAPRRATPPRQCCSARVRWA